MQQTRTLVRRNAYLLVAAGAALLLTRTIEFTPPDDVRLDDSDVTRFVGDAPAQEFQSDLPNPHTVQVRTTLRYFSENTLDVADPDPRTDKLGRILAQPIVTTVLGLNAAIHQSVRLDDGSLEVDIHLDATPRERTREHDELELETELRVVARQHSWWSSRSIERVHHQSRAFLTKIERHGHRIVFAVGEHLFALDLEVNR
jgi:hypothetical protein